MKRDVLYDKLHAQMLTWSDSELVADLKRFIESFGDHDPDCPAAPRGSATEASDLVQGRDEEFPVCACGYARRYDLLDEVHRRLARNG